MIQREARPRNLIRETHFGRWTRERGQRGEFFSSDILRYKSISREISWNWVRLLGVRSDCFWCEVLTVTHATSDSHQRRQHRLPSQHASIHRYRMCWLFAVLETFGKKILPSKRPSKPRVHSDAILGNTGGITSKLDQRNTGSQSQIHPNLQEVTFNTLLTQHRGS